MYVVGVSPVGAVLNYIFILDLTHGFSGLGRDKCKTRREPFNSLGLSDAIWRQKSGSTLAHVMACCLTAPSHNLNQCWLIISKVQWHSSKANFTRDTSAINHWYCLENQVPKISFKFPTGQWVKCWDLVRLIQEVWRYLPRWLCCGWSWQWWLPSTGGTCSRTGWKLKVRETKLSTCMAFLWVDEQKFCALRIYNKNLPGTWFRRGSNPSCSPHAIALYSQWNTFSRNDPLWGESGGSPCKNISHVCFRCFLWFNKL